MRQCPSCGGHLTRKHRASVEKVLYSDVFRCPNCDYRLKRLHPSLDSNLSFVFSRHTHCVNCGSDNVHRLQKRDRIDSMSKHPLSLLFRLTGAPLNKCPSCRLQYYDWRPVHTEPAAAGSGKPTV
jgi:predicted RNA-binding Zn-ribbon protein involved in translation (DUF1610 family)